MIIWGGLNNGSVLNTGGRYNASTDSWTATSTTNAPDGRFEHTAVWTGNEMIVWGGEGAFFVGLNAGGRYSPSMDSWVATSTRINAPSARQGHTAVWTGSQMIIWGGAYFSGGPPDFFNTGGRYNPSTDSWTATSTTNAPSAREVHTAVWTGNEMIIWGGDRFGCSYVNTGGRYNPTTDTWAATSTINSPTGRWLHTAVWTASEMIVWGRNNDTSLNSGGRYGPTPAAMCPPTPTATTTPRRPIPTPRARRTPASRP